MNAWQAWWWGLLGGMMLEMVAYASVMGRGGPTLDPLDPRDGADDRWRLDPGFYGAAASFAIRTALVGGGAAAWLAAASQVTTAMAAVAVGAAAPALLERVVMALMDQRGAAGATPPTLQSHPASSDQSPSSLGPSRAVSPIPSPTPAPGQGAHGAQEPKPGGTGPTSARPGLPSASGVGRTLRR